jgi:hypothetical protein
LFLARPKDDNAVPKSIPDFESQGAEWISFDELEADLKSKKKHLRGDEPYHWFKYVHQKKPVCPLDFLVIGENKHIERPNF